MAPDVFGRLLCDFHEGALTDRPVYRRDDGEVTDAHLEWYFSPPGDWRADAHALIDRVRGSVLDVGCGAGREARRLSAHGHEVLALDRSPGAVRVARDRGVAPVVVGDLFSLPVPAGAVDTALYDGHQLTLGGPDRLPDALSEAGRVATRVVANLADPRALDHRSYAESRTVEPGVATRTFRVEYDGHAGPWLTLTQYTPAALRRHVGASGWRLAETLGTGSEGAEYAVVLERDER